MIVRKATVYKCDLCKQSKDEAVNDRPPDRWLTINHEDLQEDRSFYDTHVCPDCVRKVVQAETKRTSS